jgi:ankyrin repeat protein
LITANADINAKNDFGATALHIAGELFNIKCVVFNVDIQHMEDM